MKYRVEYSEWVLVNYSVKTGFFNKVRREFPSIIRQANKITPKDKWNNLIDVKRGVKKIKF